MFLKIQATDSIGHRIVIRFKGSKDISDNGVTMLVDAYERIMILHSYVGVLYHEIQMEIP